MPRTLATHSGVVVSSFVLSNEECFLMSQSNSILSNFFAELKHVAEAWTEHAIQTQMKILGRMRCAGQGYYNTYSHEDFLLIEIPPPSFVQLQHRFMPLLCLYTLKKSLKWQQFWCDKQM